MPQVSIVITDADEEVVQDQALWSDPGVETTLVLDIGDDYFLTLTVHANDDE